MSKYLDPKTDVTFKKVFGQHKDILINFLNSVLPLPKGAEIESLEYLTPELLPKNPKGKDSVVDVHCKDNNGNAFIVEMQMYWSGAFKKRALFNTCKAYSYPAERGSKYSELKKVYTLSLVNDEAFTEYPNDFYHLFTLTHHKHEEIKIDGIMLIFIELPKFQRLASADNVQMSLWLRFLTEVNDTTKVISPDLQENSYISKAASLVEESAYTAEELLAIDRYWDQVSRERTALSEKYSEGELKGELKGELQGKLNVAKNLKNKKMPIDFIAEVTELSEEEISKL